MTAISKAWVTIADTAVDPDSPIDATLMTGLRDNNIHNREWIGGGFIAGAEQDHNHNGVNSALVPIGPNLIRNASFESDTSGWTITTYSGGSSAIETANDAHGAKSLSFTSTVLANGGGDALSNEFIPCGGSVDLLFEAWRKGSVANIASKAEVVWYDDAKAQISLTSIYTDTNTPTTATRARARVSSPATARWFKVKLTGGTPAAGSATGTIYFDGINSSDWTIVQAFIENAQVGQAQLKTSTASGGLSLGAGASGTVSLTGGNYAWWTASSSSAADPGFQFGNTDSSAGVIGVFNDNASTRTFNRDERYIQASPPYTHGPIFIYLTIDGLGNVVNIDVGFDPTWAYHGPTDIRPQRVSGDRAFRRMQTYGGMTLRDALASKDRALIRSIVRGQVVPVEIEREITLAYKDSDMNVAPHPWYLNPPGYFSGVTTVMLEPGTALAIRLAEIAEQSHAREVRDLIRDGYLNIGNTPIVLPSQPAGLQVLPASWKLT